MNLIFNNTFLWIIAILITVGISRHQRKTGPTYPLDGTSQIGATTFDWELKRTHGGHRDHPVKIMLNDKEVKGTILWKRFKVNEKVMIKDMQRIDNELIGFLPHQPPAGKLEYQVMLTKGSEKVLLPKDEPAVIRFKGYVTPIVLIPHILFMFLGLMVAMRTALAGLTGGQTLSLAQTTVMFLLVGGLFFGPLVQKFAFGAYWTGWPFGGDWTDNKTLVMFLVWLVASWQIYRRRETDNGRWWAFTAMIVTFAVYLIPHSMHGSELDYNAISDSLLTRK